MKKRIASPPAGRVIANEYRRDTLANLTPGVRYRALSRDMDTGDGEAPVALDYVAIELGIAFRF